MPTLIYRVERNYPDIALCSRIKKPCHLPFSLLLPNMAPSSAITYRMSCGIPAPRFLGTFGFVRPHAIRACAVSTR